ncbi:hypothetical protein [Prauserella muralis]|uniref:Uncharacterized protein n=1 Tax=Prauserella muralis TaxID=588067 RepID=A0A2V4AKN5_9PSEU|nr:hypothetical protein [Prauserella muralis]PXY20858.1 hypothetical protein BAY60_25475 [Prauserella muralis]TWE29897.1 hypothetical protein FHX69_2589 [Prauserella muralis]
MTDNVIGPKPADAKWKLGGVEYATEAEAEAARETLARHGVHGRRVEAPAPGPTCPTPWAVDRQAVRDADGRYLFRVDGEATLSTAVDAAVAAAIVAAVNEKFGTPAEPTRYKWVNATTPGGAYFEVGDGTRAVYAQTRAAAESKLRRGVPSRRVSELPGTGWRRVAEEPARSEPRTFDVGAVRHLPTEVWMFRTADGDLCDRVSETRAVYRSGDYRGGEVDLFASCERPVTEVLDS